MNKQIVLDECVIESEVEPANISKMYLKNIYKALYGKKKKPKTIIPNPEDSMSETDDEEEYLEKMYILENFGQTKEKEKHAQDLLQRYQKAEEEEVDQELKEEEKKEVNSYQEVLDEANEKSEISQVYKLFNTVCQSSKHQILRYMQPSLYRGQELIPLWASTNNVLPTDQVPVCPRCKKARTYELQIMP